MKVYTHELPCLKHLNGYTLKLILALVGFRSLILVAIDNYLNSLGITPNPTRVKTLPYFKQIQIVGLDTA